MKKLKGSAPGYPLKCYKAMAEVQEFRQIYMDTCEVFEAHGRCPEIGKKGETQIAKDRHFAQAYYALTYNNRHLFGYPKVESKRPSKDLPMFKKDQDDLKKTKSLLKEIGNFIKENGHQPKVKDDLADAFYRIRDNYDYLEKNNKYWD